MCLDRQDLRRYPRRAPTARPSADGTCSRRWIPRRLLLVAGTGDLSRRDVLRYEVLLGARHAVIVGPAVHQRQRRAEVAMPRRGAGGLPRSEETTSGPQSPMELVGRLLLEQQKGT